MQVLSIYDKDISELKKCFNSDAYGNIKKLPSDKAWEVTAQESLVLKRDMAYELGGGMNKAISSIAFTTSSECVSDDGVYLMGEDLQDIKEDISYARFTFIRLNESYIKDIQEKNAEALHAALRAVDYVRYHNFPKGYMMRISSVKEREPVRVSKQAIADGMTFSHIGSEMINAYRKRKEVEAVQIYFLTSKTADYELLYDKAHRIEQITDSLNHMFNGLVMDCSSCKSRELCDEIDGMKELHKNLSSI